MDSCFRLLHLTVEFGVSRGSTVWTPDHRVGPHPRRTSSSTIVVISFSGMLREGTCIATASNGASVITVLDLSNNTRRQINTDVGIQDIKIFDNAVFVTDGRKLASWHLAHGARLETVDVHPERNQYLLSLSTTVLRSPVGFRGFVRCMI